MDVFSVVKEGLIVVINVFNYVIQEKNVQFFNANKRSFNHAIVDSKLIKPNVIKSKENREWIVLRNVQKEKDW